MSGARDTAAAVLIDADNLAPALIDQVFLELYGRGLQIGLRRAYGGLEKLQGMREALHRHAVRATVNQGKGTTDIALAVDAMDLLHAGTLAGVIAVVSSDADFAPLAARFREAGLQVLCFAQRGKAAVDELRLAYDEVIVLDDGPPPEAPRPAPRAAVAAPAPKAAAKPAAKAAAKKASKPPNPAAAGQPAAPSAEQVVQLCPELGRGEFVPLNAIVQKLRAQKMLTKTGSGVTFFRKLGDAFQLEPPRQPNRIRWSGAGGQ